MMKIGTLAVGVWVGAFGYLLGGVTPQWLAPKASASDAPACRILQQSHFEGVHIVDAECDDGFSVTIVRQRKVSE